MQVNSDQYIETNAAVFSVSRHVLGRILLDIWEKNPSLRDSINERLFVNENEVPQPGTPPEPNTDGEYSEVSDTSDKEEEEKDDARPTPATTTGAKRVRRRYAKCINCKEEFDVTENTKRSCTYHSDLAMPDYDMWPDHDENCHGPIDTEENRKKYPGSFTYQCCDRNGDEDPCVTDWHRDRKYDYETSKRQRL